MNYKLIFIFICAGCIIFTANANAQEIFKWQNQANPSRQDSVDAPKWDLEIDSVIISVSPKINRKIKREIRIEREVDQLIVDRNFRFEPVVMNNPANLNIVPNYAPIVEKNQDLGNRGLNYLRVFRNSFEVSLPSNRIDFTYNYKVTEATKYEDGEWTMTIEVDLIDEIVKYEFKLTAKTGWGAVRVTSNRRIGRIIYYGWLVSC